MLSYMQSCAIDDSSCLQQIEPTVRQVCANYNLWQMCFMRSFACLPIMTANAEATALLLLLVLLSVLHQSIVIQRKHSIVC
jgi:hypothetical protein